MGFQALLAWFPQPWLQSSAQGAMDFPLTVSEVEGSRAQQGLPVTQYAGGRAGLE